MNNVNWSRQGEHFVPHKWNTPVTVIGAGATGSFVVLQLAKMGVKDITVYDFDVIEEHNVANQVYGLQHVGMFKVEALFDIVKEQTGIEIVPMKIEVTASTFLKGVVFCLTDTMYSRKAIFEGAVKYKPLVTEWIETRMSINCGYVYTVNPLNVAEIKRYKETLYSDDVAETSACGSSLSIVTTAVNIASLACWNVIRKFKGVKSPNEVLFDIENLNLFTTKWED